MILKKQKMDVRKKKKRLYNKAELALLDAAYGNRFTFGRQFFIAVEPALYLTVFALTFTVTWWIALIGFVIGYAYGLLFVVPKTVYADYERLAYAQRATATTILVQSILDPNQTVVKSIQTVANSIQGELSNELMYLSTVIGKRENEDSLNEAFIYFKDKYGDIDPTFIQILEQIETYVFDGRLSRKTLLLLENKHNAVHQEYVEFYKGRQNALKQARIALFIGLIVLIGGQLTFLTMIDPQIYAKWFWHWYIGWATGLIFSGAMMFVWHAIMTRLFDSRLTMEAR